MAVRTKDEILGMIGSRFSDDTSDEVLALVEDISDTLNDYESKTADQTNWKNKYEENDAQWRQKYKDRFFQVTTDDDDSQPDDEPPRKYTFEDLFK